MPDAKSIAITARVKDLTGLTFGRLTVVWFAGIDQAGKATWNCLCECGSTVVARSNNLTTGNTNSCGCVHREELTRRNTTHGRNRSPEHTAWLRLLGRCFNPNNKCYNRYGGRGITVCDRWRSSFANFLSDMGPKPAGHRISVERLNNDGNYEPGNCVWATQAQQTRNTCRTHNITFGDRTMCLTDWATERGLSEHTIRWRLKRGWSIELALMTPPRRWPSSHNVAVER
jgi:hypothetical protein